MPTPHHKGQPESLGLPKLRPPSPKTDTADVPHDDDADMQTVRVSESHPRDDTDTSTSNESESAANLPCLANVTPMDTSPREGLGSGEIQYQTLPRRQSSSLKVLRPALPSTPMVMLQRTKTLGSLHADKMLTRLGVTFETMRLEKGMKKLGICDHDIEASIESTIYAPAWLTCDCIFQMWCFVMMYTYVYMLQFADTAAWF
ncbi:hypothetical protein, variant [Aphanomyces astaci]|uniref:Uncharacterized protein n=1 Tax=Aphanomyces astaci TaxID=112090 RepID=W4G6T5_APHAT|nr:hypothetical protein, variant [Aphanomyces astaci]ETV75385.1 hypothetical protein, variant [Aphanomyces astaci]|eukprot:XP_009835019.1 hypothetical protein, variant [Aphanomyces astaci]